MPARAPNFRPGEVLPGTKYRVVRKIGVGGMGVVFQVEKPPSIQCVLKLMSTELSVHDEFRSRFLDEVRVLAQLDHPNIVKVFDYDLLADGTPYYVMELLHGRTLRDALTTMGTLPPRVAFEVTRQLLEALHCAHTHDIPVVHRDIKPENIFLHAPRHGEPVVKLIDFGVIAIADRQHDGAFVGTWKYAAPEQIRGERATPATDLYAVALVLYEMLAGVGPFDHYDTGPLVSQAHLEEIPPALSQFAPWVPASIITLVQSALSKDARVRPRDAYAFAERLFELEWASDGKDPHDRTAERPPLHALSTVVAGDPQSKEKLAAAAELGDVPVVNVPPSAKHVGTTLRGVGEGTGEATIPGEDALLDGLVARKSSEPGHLSKKARESDPSLGVGDPEPAAPPSDRAPAEASAAAPVLPAAKVDTDTFSSQESDARPAKRAAPGRLVVPLAVAALALLGIGAFAASRDGAPPAPAAAPPAEAVSPAKAASPPSTKDAVPTADETEAEAKTAAPAEADAATAATAVVPARVPAARPSGPARPKASAIGAATKPSPPPASATAPHPATPAAPAKPTKPTKPDESFVRSL
jgi:eukaryotic-like serine/threonine-protein kinase